MIVGVQKIYSIYIEDMSCYVEESDDGQNSTQSSLKTSPQFLGLFQLLNWRSSQSQVVLTYAGPPRTHGTAFLSRRRFHFELIKH